MSDSKKPPSPAARPVVYIDGEAGTTGLEIRRRLDRLGDTLDVRSIDSGSRKDDAARRAMMRQADLVVLCLPDAAAIEVAGWLREMGDAAPKVVDASTAHRVDADWIYGFAELDASQPERIASARRVANPGCYPTGGIALIRPLVDAGLIPADYPLTVNAVSGYSGGGRSMIGAYEGGGAPAFELYGLGLEHKHVPELQKYSRLTVRPIFVPSVGNYRQGMLVSVPLHLDALPGKPTARDLEAALAAHYAGSRLVEVMPAERSGRLDALALNGTDRLELRVFAHPRLAQAVLVARLDNLGKGASGAAVQNVELMLGV